MSESGSIRGRKGPRGPHTTSSRPSGAPEGKGLKKEFTSEKAPGSKESRSYIPAFLSKIAEKLKSAPKLHERSGKYAAAPQPSLSKNLTEQTRLKGKLEPIVHQNQKLREGQMQPTEAKEFVASLKTKCMDDAWDIPLTNELSGMLCEIATNSNSPAQYDAYLALISVYQSHNTSSNTKDTIVQQLVQKSTDHRNPAVQPHASAIIHRLLHYSDVFDGYQDLQSGIMSKSEAPKFVETLKTKAHDQPNPLLAKELVSVLCDIATKDAVQNPAIHANVPGIITDAQTALLKLYADPQTSSAVKKNIETQLASLAQNTANPQAAPAASILSKLPTATVLDTPPELKLPPSAQPQTPIPVATPKSTPPPVIRTERELALDSIDNFEANIAAAKADTTTIYLGGGYDIQRDYLTRELWYHCANPHEEPDVRSAAKDVILSQLNSPDVEVRDDLLEKILSEFSDKRSPRLDTTFSLIQELITDPKTDSKVRDTILNKLYNSTTLLNDVATREPSTQADVRKIFTALLNSNSTPQSTKDAILSQLMSQFTKPQGSQFEYAKIFIKQLLTNPETDPTIRGNLLNQLINLRDNQFTPSFVIAKDFLDDPDISVLLPAEPKPAETRTPPKDLAANHPTKPLPPAPAPSLLEQAATATGTSNQTQALRNIATLAGNICSGEISYADAQTITQGLQKTVQGPTTNANRQTQQNAALMLCMLATSESLTTNPKITNDAKDFLATDIKSGAINPEIEAYIRTILGNAGRLDIFS